MIFADILDTHLQSCSTVSKFIWQLQAIKTFNWATRSQINKKHVHHKSDEQEAKRNVSLTSRVVYNWWSVCWG